MLDSLDNVVMEIWIQLGVYSMCLFASICRSDSQHTVLFCMLGKATLWRLLRKINSCKIHRPMVFYVKLLHSSAEGLVHSYHGEQILSII